MSWSPQRWEAPPWLCWAKSDPPRLERKHSRTFTRLIPERRGSFGPLRHVPTPRRVPSASATELLLGGGPTKSGAIGWTALAASSILFWIFAMNSELVTDLDFARPLGHTRGVVIEAEPSGAYADPVEGRHIRFLIYQKLDVSEVTVTISTPQLWCKPYVYKIESPQKACTP